MRGARLHVGRGFECFVYGCLVWPLFNWLHGDPLLTHHDVDALVIMAIGVAAGSWIATP